LLLAKSGAKVAVSDISQEDCEKVVKEIEKSGGEAIAIRCDVSKKTEVDDMVKKTVVKWGKIDILVNNAGICQFKPFLELTEEEWDRTLTINLKGYFLCAQAAAKEMVKQKSPKEGPEGEQVPYGAGNPPTGQAGVIINIASVAMGQQGIGFPNIAHYCASKGGIIGMTEALAVELAPYNIRVNAIAPGMIETPMIDPVKQEPKMMEAMLTRVPMHRVGSPQEVSNLVLFLASDESSYMTGSTVVIDGGWLAG
jgi:NAD(P)-dependent dehydrogenase (short-subunit alcohol dehydrogenase family)